MFVELTHLLLWHVDCYLLRCGAGQTRRQKNNQRFNIKRYYSHDQFDSLLAPDRNAILAARNRPHVRQFLPAG